MQSTEVKRTQRFVTLFFGDYQIQYRVKKDATVCHLFLFFCDYQIKLQNDRGKKDATVCHLFLFFCDYQIQLLIDILWLSNTITNR